MVLTGQPISRVNASTPVAVPQPQEQVSISIATSRKEKEQVYRFRYQIYVKEMGKILSHADHKHQLLRDDMDDWGFLLFAHAGKEIVGTVRLHIGYKDDFPPDLVEVLAMDKFSEFRPSGGITPPLSFASKAMVASHFRGSSLSSRLISSYYEICRQQGIIFNLGGCAPFLTALYEHIGFRRYTRSFMVPDYGCMVPILIIAEDIDHLQKMRSPLLNVAASMPNSKESSEWFTREFSQTANYINRQMLSKEALWQLLADRLGKAPEKAINAFKGLNEAEAMHCAEIGHIYFCDQGDIVAQPTDMSHEFFVVLTGSMATRKQTASQREKMAVLSPGQSFGERVLATYSRHNATLWALTDAELLVIPRHGLPRLQAKHPEIAAKFARNLNLSPKRKYGYA